MVFAAVHILIFFQGCIKLFFLNQISPCDRNIIDDYQMIVFKDTQMAVFKPENDLFSYKSMRQDIQVAFKMDCTVFIHLPIRYEVSND